MTSASRGLRSHRCRTPPSRNCATRSRNSRKFQRERLFAASHRLTSWSARECVVMRRTCVAARGERLAAFDGRCIPAGCVAPRSNTPGIAPHRAQHARWGPRRSVVAPFDTGVPSAAAALGWSSGRLARLGATPDFHHGLLTAAEPLWDTGTFSILGYDPATGEVGGAVQSRVFSAGNGVLWAEANVGIVATQAIVDVSYGLQALALLRTGARPDAIIKQVWDKDPDPIPDNWSKQGRQLAAMNAKGEYAAFTGPKATEW